MTSKMSPRVKCLLFFFFKLILFIYFWLRWVFIAAHGLSLVAVSRGYSSLRCTGFSLRWLLLLQSTGSRHAGSVVVAHGLSCSVARGIFPDQGSNPCPPALAGGFLTTAPPGKSLNAFFVLPIFLLLSPAQNSVSWLPPRKAWIAISQECYRWDKVGLRTLA